MGRPAKRRGLPVVAGFVVASATILPLYAAQRSAPVAHPEWARMLLRALDMDVQGVTGAAQVFSILSWKQSLAFAADRYLRGVGVAVKPVGTVRQVVPTEAEGEVTYPLAAIRGGDYRLRVRAAGDPNRPIIAEVIRVGQSQPVKAFTIAPSSIQGWIDAGGLHLDTGAYTAVLRLPSGTTLERVEVAPPCVAAVEPPGGWSPTAVTQSEDVAVTVVKAIDKESELPTVGPAIEVSASSFQAEATATTVARAGPVEGLEGLWVKSGPGGTRAIVFIELPQAGLYTLSVYGMEGSGQSWLADACRKAVLCGSRREAAGSDQAKWKTLMTVPLSAGRHFFTVVLGPGAAVQKLRAERKGDAPRDYVATLKRLGFDVGPSGPIPRDRAIDAQRFVESRRQVLLANICGDVVPVTTTATRATGLDPDVPVAGPQQAGPDVGAGQPPLTPPGVPLPPVGSASPTPPVPPQSPVPPSPLPTPSPFPTATPPPPPSPSPSPSPAPSPAPTPSPVPCQSNDTPPVPSPCPSPPQP